MERTDATKKGARVEENNSKKLVITKSNLSQITGCSTGMMHFINLLKRIGEFTNTHIGFKLTIVVDPLKLSTFSAYSWAMESNVTVFSTQVNSELLEDVLCKTVIALEEKAHSYGTQEAAARKTDQV